MLKKYIPNILTFLNLSFGVAPGILIFFKYGLNNYLIGTCIMLFYIICGCYRLAKYNISEFEGVFLGIPITISGSVLALLSLIITYTKIIPGVLMIILGYLMISKVLIERRIRKVIQYRMK